MWGGSDLVARKSSFVLRPSERWKNIHTRAELEGGLRHTTYTTTMEIVLQGHLLRRHSFMPSFMDGQWNNRSARHPTYRHFTAGQHDVCDEHSDMPHP